MYTYEQIWRHFEKIEYTLTRTLTTTNMHLFWQQAPKSPNPDTIMMNSLMTINRMERLVAMLPAWKEIVSSRGFTWSVLTFAMSESARAPAIRRPSPISCQGQKPTRVSEREREREREREGEGERKRDEGESGMEGERKRKDSGYQKALSRSQEDNREDTLTDRHTCIK